MVTGYMSQDWYPGLFDLVDEAQAAAAKAVMGVGFGSLDAPDHKPCPEDLK